MPEGNRDIAGSYDRVASAYTATFGDELTRKPFDRELLESFVAAVRDRGLVADVGCGPGHIGRYLSDRGCDVVGIDLSRNIVRVGRSLDPDARFVVGDFFRLPLATKSLAGAIGFYSLIHSARAEVPNALRELKRVLREGAPLLVAVHGGTGEIHAEEFLGHPVSIDATLFEPDELVRHFGDAGFRVEEIHSRDPYDFESSTQRVYVHGRA